MDPIIDVHTHYLPPAYINALKHHIPGNPDGWPTPTWTPETTLKFMSKNNIGYSLLSLSSPHFNFGDKAETSAIARDANQTGSALAHTYSKQLGYLASLPLPYVNESVAEVDWALQHAARGFTVPTNTRGLYFGSPIFDELYQRLNHVEAIVALHPNQPAALPMNVNIDLPTPLMGFFMDTTMTFMNLLKYHFFDRFPDIKLIVPHAGAFLSILADRDAVFVKSSYQADMYAALQHVYFDTAGAVFPRQLPMLMTLANPQHLLYGSDIPYTDLKVSSELLGVLKNGHAKSANHRRQLIQVAQHFDHFFDQHRKLRQLPAVLDMEIKMLNGAEILTPALKQAILVDNARRLLAHH
ncbi:amidohydrolase family protein [Lactiplantibacillus daowaiensis]|uniref:6-methylsalicylate decarboxylase n=1 Tax=Lactiplantibacillus daowaiensis TaxID=2559918 RepID=A0ABW1S2B4_9LACO|nr:amidohydrolase family protein [Lactiplantibacillus daowaiensis]